jgi:protoporphyrinogen/coproporphyrinogen III oxidase
VPTSSSMLEGVRGLSRRARAHAKRDELVPARLHVGEDISIGEILRTKLGPELTYRFIEPMIGGIQAGRIDQLSAKSVFPTLFEAAQKRGSLMRNLKALSPATSASNSPLFYTLTSGVGSLCVEVARQLRARGVVVRTGVAATALRRSPSGSYPWEVDTPSTTTTANAIIVTTPASDTARLLGHFDPALEALARVASASAAMVTFSVDVKHITLPEHGTGVLVPLMSEWSGEGSMMVTAITLLDRKWPHLAREGDVLLRAHVGRSDDERFMALDDDQLVARVAQELSVLLPRFASYDEALVQRWPHALPQYYVGHEEMVRAARVAAKGLQLALAGNAYDGVGVPASIGSGRAAARQILESVARD